MYKCECLQWGSGYSTTVGFCPFCNQPLKVADLEDDQKENDDEFQPCNECDGHDACADFGCAIKAGLAHLLNKPL